MEGEFVGVEKYTAEDGEEGRERRWGIGGKEEY